MQYIERTITPQIKRAVNYFPVIVVTGPRQSGKSTLCNHLFPDYSKYNLEDIALRLRVQEDPKEFLSSCGNNVIIDEVQNAPEILSYIQTIVDREDSQRHFILTGSSNFSLMESITQSLAGRAALFTLLPLSFSEIGDLLFTPTNTLIIRGFYPSVITGKRPADLFYPSYYSTYVERDLYQIKNITNLSAFQNFMRLTAGRCGTEFNASQVAMAVGVSSPTIKAWMSILQTSYICHLLQPWHSNLKKRLTKTPKIYFYDTGLLCFLLGIEAEEQLAVHPLRGAIFENMAVSELIKRRFNEGKRPDICFYRENSGKEADIVRIVGEQLDLYEIKSAMTYNKSFSRNLNYLRELLGAKIRNTTIVYDGDPIPPSIINIRDI